MDEAALFEFLSQAEAQNPGALQQMIDAGLFGDRSALAGQDMAQGQGMMQTPGAEGMRVGGTYVAANPLEHASVAMSRIMGAQKMQDARGKQDALVGQKGQGMEALIRAMSQRGQPNPMQQDPNAAAPWLPPMPYTTY